MYELKKMLKRGIFPRLRTANKFGVTYGRFEARAQLPAGKFISSMALKPLD